MLKRMINHIAAACETIGLNVHPDKTKILHNSRGHGCKVKEAKIGSMVVEVFGPQATTTYLGTSLALTETHDVEIGHRIKKAWAKFGAYRKDLLQRTVYSCVRMLVMGADGRTRA